MINRKKKHIGYSDYDYVTSNEEKPIVYAVSSALIAACFFLALSKAYQSCIPVASPLSTIITATGMIISGAAAFLMQQGKIPKGFASIQIIPIIITVIITGAKRLYGGILGIINFHIKLWNEYYSDGKPLFKSDLITDFGINAVTIIIAISCVVTIIYLLKYNNAILSLLIIAAAFLPSLILDEFNPVAFSLAVSALWAITMERIKPADINRRMHWIFIFGIISLIFAFGITNAHSQAIDNMKQAQRQTISDIRFGKDSLPEGDLKKASDMLTGNDERLIITSEYGRDLYLRGFVGAKYKDGKWQELKNSDYGSGSAGIISWLNKNDFKVQYQYSRYISNNDKSFDANNITVKNVGAKRNYIYLPYSANPFSKKATYTYGDLNTKSSAPFGTDSYDFCEQSDRKPPELYTLDSWYSSYETESEKEYIENETVYRKFVYENYLDTDDTDSEKINEMFWQNASEDEKTNLLSAIERIREVLEENCAYNETCDFVRQSDDPIYDFLFSYQTGNACLFASSAVEALRCVGFPARYTEGYLLKNSEKLEETVTLTTDDAHAWVEVYMDGVGWLPIDFTPGFYYDTYALVSLVDAPSESKKVNSDPNGDSNKGRNFSSDSSDIKKRSTPEEKKRDAFVAIGILALVILLGALILSAIELYRIIKVNSLRKKTEKAEPKLRQKYICRIILELLRLDGIPVTLGRNAEDTARLLEQKHPEIQTDEYLRVYEITEKLKYADVTLQKHEEQTLIAFLEKYLDLIEKNTVRRINLLSKIKLT